MKYTNLILLVALLSCVPMAAVAVDETEKNEASTFNLFESMPNVEVHQDAAVLSFMERYWKGSEQTEVEMQGWRVQIFSSNNQQVAKQQAESLRSRMENSLPEPVYVSFIQPFWKVRVGDFLTLDEARNYRDTLIKDFPELHADAYPVKDIIKVRQ